MIADRLNNFGSNNAKQERRKILRMGDKGPVIACSGNSQFIDYLFSKLIENWSKKTGTTVEKIINIYKGLFYEVYETNKRMSDVNIVDPVIDTISAELIDEKIMFFSAVGFIPSMPSECNRIIAIPGNFQELQPYLEINTRKLSEEKAIKLGEEILRQMAFVNNTVGAPEYYGFDYVNLTSPCISEIKNKKADLRKLDPTKLIEYIKFEEEGP